MKKKRTANEILAIENLYSEYINIKGKASDLADLRKNKRSKDGYLTVVDGAGEDHVDVTLSVREYEAIRRYLIRNRVRELRAIGADV